MIKKTVFVFLAYAAASALANYLIVHRILGIGSMNDIPVAWTYLCVSINMLFIPIFLTLIGIAWLKKDAVVVGMEAFALLALQLIFLLDFENRVGFILGASGILLAANAAYLCRLMLKSQNRISRMMKSGARAAASAPMAA